MSGDIVSQTRWELARYGKVVQAPLGPIVPGIEHAITGRSESFPSALLPFVHPSRLSLGDRDPSRWRTVSWARRGGIVSMAVAGAGVGWVLLARQRERPESGESGEGRRYTEMLVAAISAAEFDACMFGEVARAMRAEPPTAAAVLTPLCVSADACVDALPHDWRGRIAPLLASLLSGVPVGLELGAEDPDDFTDTLALLLSALPPVLAWRVPVGAGLMTADGAQAVASAVLVRGDLRRSGGDGSDAYPDALAAGRGYVDWLADVTVACTSRRALRDAVRDALPHLSRWDSIDPTLDWRSVARRVAEAAGAQRVVASLLRALEAGTALAALDDVMEYADAVLEALVARAAIRDSKATHVSHLLELIARRCPTAWHRLAEDGDGRGIAAAEFIRALAMRHGVLRADDAGPLLRIADCEVAAAVEPAIVRRLCEAVAASGPDRGWLALASCPAISCAGWVRRWRSSAQAPLARLCLLDALRPADPAPRGSSPPRGAGARPPQQRDPLDALSDLPAVDAALRVLGGERIDAAHLHALLDLCETDGLAVLQALEDAAPTALDALRVAERALQHGQRTELAQRIDPHDGSAGDAAVAAELRGGVLAVAPTSDHSVGLLTARILCAGGLVPPKPWRSLVARAIGEPWSSALLGDSVDGGATSSGLVPSWWPVWIGDALDDSRVAALCRRWTRFDTSQRRGAARLLTRWLTAAAPASPRESAEAMWLRFLVGRAEHPPVSRNRGAQPVWLRSVAGALRLPHASAWLRARDPALVRQLVLATSQGAASPPFETPGLQLLLERLGDDVLLIRWWQDRLKALGWTQAEGWRLLLPRWAVLARREQALLRALGPDHLARLLVSGFPLPGSVLHDVERQHLEQAIERMTPKAKDGLFLPTPVALRHCLQQMSAMRRHEFAGFVLRHAMRRAIADGMHKAALEAELMPVAWPWRDRLSAFWRGVTRQLPRGDRRAAPPDRALLVRDALQAADCGAEVLQRWLEDAAALGSARSTRLNGRRDGGT